MRQGIGVLLCMLSSAIALGMCPQRAPAKNSLEEVKMPPLTDPKVEQATNRGITHHIGPSMRYAKVYK